MNFSQELSAMQQKYEKRPLKNLHLQYPAWLRPNDPMAAVFREMEVLGRQGTVAYAQIVQANTILFRLRPHVDCPAHFIYSTDPYIGQHPELLRDVAHRLYSYKNRPSDAVPAQRILVRQIQPSEDSGAHLTGRLSAAVKRSKSTHVTAGE